MSGADTEAEIFDLIVGRYRADSIDPPAREQPLIIPRIDFAAIRSFEILGPITLE